ncbi:MAG: hypothetical protein ABI658_23620 [Acidimicrobiales bacterium]
MAVTVFFAGPVELPAGLPTLAGGAEQGKSRDVSEAVITRTSPLVASAAIVFVVDGGARYMTTIPDQLLDQMRAIQSEKWTQR